MRLDQSRQCLGPGRRVDRPRRLAQSPLRRAWAPGPGRRANPGQPGAPGCGRPGSSLYSPQQSGGWRTHVRCGVTSAAILIATNGSWSWPGTQPDRSARGWESESAGCYDGITQGGSIQPENTRTSRSTCKKMATSIWHILLVVGLCDAFMVYRPVGLRSNSKSYRPQQARRKTYQCCNPFDSRQPSRKTPMGHWNLIEVGGAVTEFDKDVLSQAGNRAIEFCEADESYRSFLLPGNIPLRLKQLSFMEVRDGDAPLITHDPTSLTCCTCCIGQGGLGYSVWDAGLALAIWLCQASAAAIRRCRRLRLTCECRAEPRIDARRGRPRCAGARERRRRRRHHRRAAGAPPSLRRGERAPRRR